MTGPELVELRAGSVALPSYGPWLVLDWDAVPRTSEELRAAVLSMSQVPAFAHWFLVPLRYDTQLYASVDGAHLLVCLYRFAGSPIAMQG